MSILLEIKPFLILRGKSLNRLICLIMRSILEFIIHLQQKQIISQ